MSALLSDMDAPAIDAELVGQCLAAVRDVAGRNPDRAEIDRLAQRYGPETLQIAIRAFLHAEAAS